MTMQNHFDVLDITFKPILEEICITSCGNLHVDGPVGCIAIHSAAVRSNSHSGPKVLLTRDVPEPNRHISKPCDHC